MIYDIVCPGCKGVIKFGVDNDQFSLSKEEAIQLLDFIRQSEYISYEAHPLISPLADRIRDYYKEKR